MHREVIADIKTVYYRGRYRASVAWPKVGKEFAAENLPMIEVYKSRREEVPERRRKTGSSLEPAT